MNKFRTLRADELDCRVGTCNEKGFTLLLYKDARCDQNILDETVGAENWQRDHKEVKGNLFCGVSIWDDVKKQWITKWDCGVESNTEKEKGEASDSFKRACFNWGIGRELYTSPFIYIKGNTEKNNKGKDVPTFRSIKVSEIAYTDGKITKLTILGDGEVIYTFNGEKADKKPDMTFEEKVEKAKAYVIKVGQFAGVKMGDLSKAELQVISCGANEGLARLANVLLEDLERCPF